MKENRYSQSNRTFRFDLRHCDGGLTVHWRRCLTRPLCQASQREASPDAVTPDAGDLAVWLGTNTIYRSTDSLKLDFDGISGVDLSVGVGRDRGDFHVSASAGICREESRVEKA